ncbi:MAG: phosphoribosyltransferase family protein [Candidatus Micrarchaeota archaeon]|nr:phosphoribosyltransferase family protein [Candidatus Micrarchaeota archaeon]
MEGMKPIPVSWGEIFSSAPWKEIEHYQPGLVVGIARGGIQIGAAASTKLAVPLAVVTASLYTDDKPAKEKHAAPVISGVPQAAKGARILLCDDVSNTGRTLDAVKAKLLGAGAKEVRTFVYAGKADFSCRTFEKCLRFPWEN